MKHWMLTLASGVFAVIAMASALDARMNRPTGAETPPTKAEATATATPAPAPATRLPFRCVADYGDDVWETATRWAATELDAYNDWTPLLRDGVRYADKACFSHRLIERWLDYRYLRLAERNEDAIADLRDDVDALEDSGDPTRSEVLAEIGQDIKHHESIFHRTHAGGSFGW